MSNETTAAPAGTLHSRRRVAPRRLAPDWFGALVLVATATLLFGQLVVLVLFDII